MKPEDRSFVEDRSHGRRKWDKLYPVMFAASIALTIIASVLSYTAVLAVDERVESELRQCARVQTLRERVNAQGSIIYRVLYSASQAAASPVVREEYGKLLPDVTYEPPVTCRRAVEEPAGYELPEPIPYGDLLREGLFSLETGAVDESGVVARSESQRRKEKE